MNINSISNYNKLPLMTSPAQTGFAQVFQAPASSTSSASTTSTSGDGTSGTADSYFQQAIAKLQQIDPTLAQKLETFQQQGQQTLTDGGSMSDVASQLKQDVSSLSDNELSEAQSVLKSGHHHRHVQFKNANDPTDPTQALSQDPLTALETAATSGPVVAPKTGSATQDQTGGPNLPFCPIPNFPVA